MITSRAVSALLLHRRRRVDVRHAVNYDFAGALTQKPAWMHLMAMRRRKTLVICRRCHEDIHAGRATTPNR